jgi:PAS domain S-box-containing protein
MKKLKYIIYNLTVFLYTLCPSLVYAADEPSSGSATSIIRTVFMIVIIIAIPIFIIIALKRMQYLQALEADKEKLVGQSAEEIEALISEKANLPPSVSTKVIKPLAKVFRAELTKQVQAVSQAVERKYDAVVKQKDAEYEKANKRLNKALFEKHQTESVVRSVAEGVVVLDNEGNVVMSNPAAEKLLGVDKKDIAGRSLTKNVQEGRVVSLSKPQGKSGEKKIEVISPDEDTKKTIRSSSAVIENELGETVGMVSVLTDITKQKELDEARTSFVSRVTHGLRTPILAMKNSLKIFLGKTGSLDPGQKTFVDTMDRNLQHLTRLADELLDFSKIEERRLSLNLKKGSIAYAIEETCGALSAWAKAKDITIEQKIGADLPEVSFDYHRIVQVLTNIIGNAVKFTPCNGTITVEAGLSEAKKNIFVSITDTGPGIEKEDLDRIFKPFEKDVGYNLPSDSHGAGLGLYIAKELIQYHGGAVWAESGAGKGARVSFTLPTVT